MKKVIFSIILLFNSPALSEIKNEQSNTETQTTTPSTSPKVSTPPTKKPPEEVTKTIVPPKPQEEHKSSIILVPTKNEPSEKLSSLSFLPSKGDLYGSTSFSSEYFELDSDQASVLLNSSAKSYRHLLAYGLTDRVTLGLSINYIASGNSDLVVNGSVTSSTQLETGVSSPEVALGLRVFKRGDVSDFWNLNFFYNQNPKSFSDRSIYTYILDSIFTISDRFSIGNSLQYVTLSETSVLTSSDLFNLFVTSQFYFTDFFYISGKAGVRFMSTEGYKGSNVVFENTIGFIPEISIGGDVSSSVMWSFSINSYHSKRDITNNATSLTGYETIVASTFSLSYLF